jgi:hypothetical protein
MSRPITEANAAKVQAWCRQHDWGRQAQIATMDGQLSVRYLIEEHRDEGGVLQSELRHFDDIEELRAWAGY